MPRSSMATARARTNGGVTCIAPRTIGVGKFDGFMRRMMCKDEARVKLDFARHLEAVFRVEGVKLRCG